MSRRRKIANEQILSATRRLLAHRGSAVTTRAIAAELGISEGVLFQRFESKSELFRAALSVPRIDSAHLVSESRTGNNAREVLENIGIAIFGSLRSLLPLYLPRISMPDLAEDNELTSRSSPFSLFVSALEEHLATERHTGRIWMHSPHATAYLIVSMLHNVALFDAIAGPSSATSEGAVRDLIGIVWSGLEPRRPSA